MRKNVMLISVFFICAGAFLIVTAYKKQPRIHTPNGRPFKIRVNNVESSVKSITTKIQTTGFNKNYVQIAVTLSNDDVAFVEIFYDEIGTSETLDVSKDYRGDFGYQGYSDNPWYEASVKHPGSSGKISITKNDPVNKLIEGTFSGVAVSSQNELDKNTITDGSFAVNY